VLADTEAIRALVYRYAALADARDAGGMAECFTPDGVVVSGERTAEGRPALRALFEEFLRGDLMGAAGSSTHLTSNVVVDAHGPSVADVQVQAVAFLAPDGSDRIVLRGLRYEDVCRLTADGWLFARRTHRVTWQAECPGTPVAPLLAAALKGIDA
jgi:uncharacterized protein (TIGR02246 family)